MKKNDAFVVLPTGGGKSLTFQLPAVAEAGVTLVVMPLISLIQNQKLILDNLGIGSWNLSQFSLYENDKKFEEIVNGNPYNIKIIFLTPEKLVVHGTLALIAKLHSKGLLERVVIDEAHCVCKWGNSFRVSYLKLSILKENFPDVPTLALTATATRDTVNSCILELRMSDSTILFKGNPNRKNLIYETQMKSTSKVDYEKIKKILICRFYRQNGIIYCRTIRQTEEFCSFLDQVGVKAQRYHGKMDTRERERVFEDWMQDRFKVIVATISLGMGIDKKNVRFVIHYGLPKVVAGPE